jgi:hypothetical protein
VIDNEGGAELNCSVVNEDKKLVAARETVHQTNELGTMSTCSQLTMFVENRLFTSMSLKKRVIVLDLMVKRNN